MHTKIARWGNSLGLRIPKTFAEEMHVREGTVVELSLEDGQLVIRAAPQSAVKLENLLAEITDENLHSEMDIGGAVGGEIW